MPTIATMANEPFPEIGYLDETHLHSNADLADDTTYGARIRSWGPINGPGFAMSFNTVKHPDAIDTTATETHHELGE